MSQSGPIIESQPWSASSKGRRAVGSDGDADVIHLRQGFVVLGGLVSIKCFPERVPSAMKAARNL
jgi:hypothetical protein